MTQAGGPAASRKTMTLAVLLPLVLLLALASSAQAAAPPLLWKKGQNCGDNGKSGAGECGAVGETVIPRGVAVDPATGNIYVADQSNSRVDVFTAWGVFVKAWGWGVADGSPELQTCGPGATPPTPTCQAGLQGSGAGQFDGGVEGIALDSEVNVYAVDFSNHRVQKFDSEGNLLLMIGGDVDQGGGAPSNPGNLCTAQYITNGDTCGSGATGAANGQFSANWPVGSFIAVGTNDSVYVGDQNRIQKFDSDGHYTGQIPLPEEGVVGSLTFDTYSGALYIAYWKADFSQQIAQPNVFKLDPVTGDVLDTLEVDKPTALATDAVGNVYVFQREYRSGPQFPGNHPDRILRFDSAGSLEGVVVQNEELGTYDQFDGSTGIAVGSSCGVPDADLYVTNPVQENSYISAYGPPPNPSICPPPSHAPSVGATYTLSVDSDAGTVRAQINPHFWPDARYYVEYGTGQCSAGECDRKQPAEPGSLLTTKVLDEPFNTANVLLTGLAPDTTYNYRFVAKSSGGGPTTGVERSFHTFVAPTPPSNPDPCPNAAFRIGPSAGLPDCRAFEMVSPLDKNNGDVSAGGQSNFVQAAAGGERMTFSSFRAFAGAEAAALSSQYLASRDAVNGWVTESLSPPREDISYYPIGSGEGMQYKAFSEDLCSGWVLQDSGIALTPGAPAEVPNIYRRKGCGAGGYELATTTAPAGYSHAENGGYSRYWASIQGFSADGEHSLLHAPAALTPNANPKKGVFQVYETYDGGKLRLVSLLPNGSAATTNSSVGTSQKGVEDGLRYGSVYRAVSVDGSRVFWSASKSQVVGNPYVVETGKLYLRVNAAKAPSKISAGKCIEPVKACTIMISDDFDTTFETADPQGTTAIYAVGDLGAGNAELYEFDVATETPHLIAKGVEGMLGASEDATRVYFVSSEVLSGEEESSEGEKAELGKRNLYLYQAGAGFDFRRSFARGRSHLQQHEFFRSNG